MVDNGFSSASDSSGSAEESATPMPRDRGSPPNGPDQELTIPPGLVDVAKRIKAVREVRATLLDPSLFGEPAWNMLLALYVAAGEQYVLPISALCAESGAPATTAIRSIKRMLELEMVQRVPNPGDNRSTYIELTRDTTAKLTELLHRIRRKFLAD